MESIDATVTLVWTAIKGIFMTYVLLEYAKHNPEEYKKRNNIQISIAAILGLFAVFTLLMCFSLISSAIPTVELIVQFFVFLSLAVYAYMFKRSETKLWIKGLKVILITIFILTFMISIQEVEEADWCVLIFLIIGFIMLNQCDRPKKGEVVRSFDLGHKKNGNNPNKENAKEKRDLEDGDKCSPEYCPYCGRLIGKDTMICKHCGKVM